MKKLIHQSLRKKERGQAIILVAFGIIGLVAMVGLVVDTGIMFIEYGKLKRGVDSASIAAAQQYRSVSGGSTLDQLALENAARNFLQLNQSDVLGIDIAVHSCEDPVVADRPDQCNPDPIGNPIANRKLVEVTASKQVEFGFLRVIGIQSTNISTTSVGEAAALDLVLLVDTSTSMAYETSGVYAPADPANDPSVCNLDDSCEPMASVKEVALDFIDTMYFPYDRVSVVSMTSQVPGGDRTPVPLIPLTSTKATVVSTINDLKVFEPRVCDGTDAEGACLNYDAVTSVFTGTICPHYELHADEADADPSSCPSSNIGGTLLRAANQLDDPVNGRPESFWVVVALMGGPANATDPLGGYPNGACPKYTWLTSPWCRDRAPTVRHAASDLANYTNPVSGITETISIYDADDYARDMADQLAALTSESGVTIYTIGLGTAIQSTATVDAGEPAPAEDLLRYIAETAGGPDVVHGQYFFAPSGGALSDIFELIANNIATRISQ